VLSSDNEGQHNDERQDLLRAFPFSEYMCWTLISTHTNIGGRVGVWGGWEEDVEDGRPNKVRPPRSLVRGPQLVHGPHT